MRISRSEVRILPVAPPVSFHEPAQASPCYTEAVIAFFDIDNTLVKGQTGLYLGLQMVRTGRMKKRQLASMALYFLILYRTDRLQYGELIKATGRFFKGARKSEAMHFGREVYRLYVKPRLFREAVFCVKWHQRRGHRVALLSSTPILMAKPIADDLGIDDLLVTYPLVAGGRLTGEVQRPYCYGEGKLYYARKLAKEAGTSLDKAFFYTDGVADLSLLEQVGAPVCVNPDPLLTGHARRRGWTRLRFRQTVGKRQRG